MPEPDYIHNQSKYFNGNLISPVHAGSTLCVLHKDAFVANDNPRDPWAQIMGVDAHHMNVRPFSVWGIGQYLDLFMVWSDPNAAFTQLPLVRVYGEVPEACPSSNPAFEGQMQMWPEDQYPEDFPRTPLADGSDESTGKKNKSFWVPLIRSDQENVCPADNRWDDPYYLCDIVGAVYGQAWGPEFWESGTQTWGGPFTDSTAQQGRFAVGLPMSFPLRGCKRILVTIESPASVHEAPESAMSTQIETELPPDPEHQREDTETITTHSTYYDRRLEVVVCGRVHSIIGHGPGMAESEEQFAEPGTLTTPPPPPPV